VTGRLTHFTKKLFGAAIVIAGCAIAATALVAPAAADETALPVQPVFSLSAVELGDEATCLAQNIYFEARSEPVAGMLAVGHVVLNRVGSERFPDTICGVVRQGGNQRLHRCQFSWWCDGRSDKPYDQVAWNAARMMAWFIYNGHTEDPTGGALWSHADYVSPSWREAFVAGPQIGRHIFYLNAERTGSSG